MSAAASKGSRRKGKLFGILGVLLFECNMLPCWMPACNKRPDLRSAPWRALRKQSSVTLADRPNTPSLPHSLTLSLPHPLLRPFPLSPLGAEPEHHRHRRTHR